MTEILQSALGQQVLAARFASFIWGMMQVLKVNTKVPALCPLSSSSRLCSRGSTTQELVEPSVTQKLAGGLGT